MPADIMKLPDDPILVTHNDQRKPCYRNRDRISWTRDVLSESHAHPGAREDLQEPRRHFTDVYLLGPGRYRE